ncbi:MAG TPA: hypothetical protein VNS81_10230 [Nocardioides sp.]|nr:hypothetical protein [Nocardioides sp.]
MATRWRPQLRPIAWTSFALAIFTGYVPVWWYGAALVPYGDSGDDAPMDAGSDRESLCLPERGSGDFTNGANVIRYRGETPLTITAADLVDGRGFHLAEVLVVPVRPHLVGSWTRWPPPHPSTALEGAVPAKGAQMSRDTVTEYNLVAHLTRERVDEPTAAPALRLFYTVGNDEYGTVATKRLGVSSDGRSCW